ncbi:MAG: hypothetical protein IJZ36_04875 [Bacilli bacterium]|nr:hypothetical protein [Bacilli bacterium]
MGKITQEQIKNINSKCMNDWRLDVEYYVFHNEKTLKKHIKLDDEHYLEFALRYNYKNQISLHISKFYHKQGDYFASSNGLGKSKILNETQAKRKNVNDLIEFTKTLTNNELMEINKNTEVTKSCMFVSSEQF